MESAEHTAGAIVPGDEIRTGGGVKRRRIRIKQVDVFTETPMNGNHSGVVLDAAGLSDKEMQAIAREIGVSETAFIRPGSQPGVCVSLRSFGPRKEFTAPGHSMLAALHALAEEQHLGMNHDGVFDVAVESSSGVFHSTVERLSGRIDVWCQSRLPSFSRATTHKLDIMRILNIGLSDFDAHLPIVADSHVYVPLRRLHLLFALQPNMLAVSHFLTNRNLSGLCVFTTETVERTSAVHSRFFAPHLGIDEDPVTNSSHGPLGVYLFQHGLLDGGQRGGASRTPAKSEDQERSVTFIAEQGDAVGRNGRVRVRIDARGSEIIAAHVGGRSLTVLDADLVVD
jgi:PhzF family phenazine biosynthesis protein